MDDGPGLARVLAAVDERARDDGATADGDGHARALDPTIAVELARTALRRLPEGELHRMDVWRVADHLVTGTRLLAERADTTAVTVRADAHPVGADGRRGTVVQLATDDRPLLLSTVLDELRRRDLRVVRRLHPIVGTERDDDGTLLALRPARDTTRRETLLHLVVDRRLDDDDARDLGDRLGRLVEDVRAATDDVPAMRAVLRAHADRLRTLAPASPAGDDPTDDPAEVAALLDWLLDDHALLLGVRRYELVDASGTPVRGDAVTHVCVDPGSGAGLLADAHDSRYLEPVALADLEPSLAATIRTPRHLEWSRTRRRSTVQRRVRMEHLALGVHDDDGHAIGVLRVLVLFTRRGEDALADATPVLRRKLAAVLEGEEVVPGSHDELVLTDLFQALPKDELFPVTVTDLRRTLLGLLHAEDHREIRTLLRVDAATRTVSVLVAVPRDTFTPQLRDRVEQHLTARFDADRVDVTVALGDRNEAVARYLLTLEHDAPHVRADELEDEVRRLARSWPEELRSELVGAVGADQADTLLSRFVRRLPRSYRDTVDPATAAADVQQLAATADGTGRLTITWHETEARDRWRLRVASRDGAPELSSLLPVLESLGLRVVDEVPHRLLGTDELHLHDLGVRVPGGAVGPLRDAAVRAAASDAVRAAWVGHAEVDGLTELVVLAGLTWRDLAVLRAYRRYRRQLGTPYTPAYVEATLLEHATATAALLGRFRARFDPGIADDARDAAQHEADAAFETTMAEVTRLDADRILRGLSTLVDATLRTNAYRPDAVADGSGEPYVALKLDPSRIADVPAPVPHREVFVRSPRVEGVHLRGGPVARGGLRWSDRPDDVRTEVLGLVKAQVLKNALIVPTGAKGGFVLVEPPSDPQALRDEVQRQYVTFVRGLLDVTDDLEVTPQDDGGDDRVVGPADVVRHDGDDPYLVVAADRGTATFSDTANAVARRYGFWLGDAFASGGSRGYDHKALGVTAKGAWRAVARHFRELGIDVATEPITIAGVGDLSGDVFSNGLLRSRAVQLVAAFDHRHVFVDPDPDPETSFVERQRVAALERSTWDDYDRDALSAGGFVVPRDVRRVELTPQARERLRLDADEVSPPQLIRAILGAPVDLLWAGGIGTYVKARDERHDDVGDRANDEVRVDASAVRARVIGEGANLFVTQRARIELSRRGSRVDQDAIHNAAGVATSDAEVNLKILLDLAIADGRLAAAERDDVLAELADDVVAAVLDAVDRQVAALSAEVARGEEETEALDRFVTRLEAAGELDREVEVLPSSQELAARSGGGFTRPELATLLAWAKRELKGALLDGDLAADPILAPAAVEPFPPAVVERFGDLLVHHRLRRELIATAVANATVDRLGIAFASDLADETGRPLALVARATRIATTIVDAPRWWDEVERLNGTLDPERVRELAAVVDRTVTDLTTTLLRDPTLVHDPAALRDRDVATATAVLGAGFTLGSNGQRRARVAHARWLLDDLVDPDLARFLACARDLTAVPDVSRITADLAGRRAEVTVADVAFRLAEALGIETLVAHLDKVPAGDGWARRQRRGVADDLRLLRRDVAHAALVAGDDAAPEDVAARFVTGRGAALDRARRVVADASAAGPDLDAVAVAVRDLRDAVLR